MLQIASVLMLFSSFLFADWYRTAHTVVDTSTRLEWQDTQVNVNHERKWRDSETYCKTLDLDKHYDWRLPTLKELETIVEKSHDTSLFHYALKDSYWSRDEDDSIVDAYQIYFANGHVSTWNKCETLHYRCVRFH